MSQPCQSMCQSSAQMVLTIGNTSSHSLVGIWAGVTRREASRAERRLDHGARERDRALHQQHAAH